jgi:ribosomal-protein-alanine N-acetyltransferase
MSAIMRRPQPVPLPRIDITRMRRRHLRKVLAIESRVYPRPWSMSLFLSEIGQKSTRSYIVIRVDGEVAGYAGMMFIGFEGHVTNIAVDPEHHGRKLGTRLLLTAITEAIARGCETISLEVRVTNQVAQDMYTKFGFHVVGVRKGYYIETKEDALVMEVAGVNGTEYRERLASIRAELDAVDGRSR